jgi:hypothetical protein
MSAPPAPSESNLLMWPFRAGWPLKKPQLGDLWRQFLTLNQTFNNYSQKEKNSW